jgi:hypothetical protein
MKGQTMNLTITINRTDNPLVSVIVTATQEGSDTAPVAGWISKDPHTAIEQLGAWLARDHARHVAGFVHLRNGKEVVLS